MINTEPHKPVKVQRIGDYRIPGPKENIYISQGSGIINEEGSERLQDPNAVNDHKETSSGYIRAAVHRNSPRLHA